MNIPTQSGQGPADPTGYYQSLYAAPAAKSTFAQTIAQSQSSWLSLTTAEGDLVTLSDLGLSYQQTQGVGWFSPISSGVRFSGSATSAEAMGLSVQGDLNAQELADITRLVGVLTSIASAFFSGDYENAMNQAMDFGDLGLGSVSSLAASFSSHTVTQTRLTSHQPLPAQAALNDQSLKDLYKALETGAPEKLDYAEMLEARWQQILKALDEMKEKELDGLFARRAEPQPAPPQVLPVEAEAPSPQTNDPDPLLRKNDPSELAESAEDRVARQMLAHLEKLLGKHPKLSPFAGPLATTAMEKAAGRAEQPDTAKAFGTLRDAFRNRLHQWFFPPDQQATTGSRPAV